MTWGTVSEAHFVAQNPPSGPYGTKSNVQVAPTSVNLQVQGADMSGANVSDAAVTAAQAALPTGGGEIWAPPGIVKVQNTILLAGQNYNALKGAGRGLTTITSAVDIPVVQLGNRQSSGTVYTTRLEDLTVQQTGATQTHAAVLVDGMGLMGTIRRVSADGGYYNFELMDLDRNVMDELAGQNSKKAGIFLEVGLQNTYGKVTFINPDISLASNNTYAIWVAANADQGSPNTPGNIEFIGGHFQSPGTTGHVGLQADIGCSITFLGTAFEQFINYMVLGATANAVNLVLDSVAFGQNSGSATDGIQTNASHIISVRDCNFKGITNVFHGVAGFASFILEGRSVNGGSLTNIWTGQFGNRFGTDVAFAGDNVLVAGFAGGSGRLAGIFARQFQADATGVGFYNHATVAQPAAPVTLADVIAIIRGCGLSA